jgi:hypothetical protein
VVENSQRVVLASALLRSGSVASTTGHFALEAWHGFDMPDMVVPKLFLNAVAAVNKKPVGFGFSPTSFTLHYEDGAWLRTQLYSDKWPDIDRVLNHPYNAVPVPEEFFPAIETIKEFSSDDRVRIRPGRVQSHQSSEIGATLEVEGLDGNLTLPIKHMKYLSKIVKYIDIVGNNGITLLYGDGVRGAISQFKE